MLLVVGSRGCMRIGVQGWVAGSGLNLRGCGVSRFKLFPFRDLRMVPG